MPGHVVITGGGGSVAVGNITGLGTGVATALAVNVGSAGAPVVLNGALGTPSSGTLTNATGLPMTGLSGLSASNGCSLAAGVVDELLTIAAAATTDTTATFTAGDIVFGPFFRVTVQPPGTATFDAGIAGATTRFGTGISTVDTTTNKVPGVASAMGSAWVATAGAVAVRITPNATPSDTTGRIRVVWFYFRPTAPTG